MICSSMGVGFRPTLHSALKACETRWGFFDIHPENYLSSRGAGFEKFEYWRSRKPFDAHSLSLNLGGKDPIDKMRVSDLKNFYKTFEPRIISDHLCWTSHHGRSTYDLLPLPRTEEVLNRCVSRALWLQDAFQRSIAFENISAYVEWSQNEMSEAEFIVEFLKRSGAKLLLDINNLVVNELNHRSDSMDLLKRLNSEQIASIHIAGHLRKANVAIDTHAEPVHDDTWTLLSEAFRFLGSKPVLIEWDDHFPSEEILKEHLSRLETIVLGANDVAA